MPVLSVRDFERAVQGFKGGDVITLLVRRPATTLFARIKIPG